MAQEPTPRIAERGVIAGGLRIATAMSDAPRSLLARVPLVVLPEVGFVWEDYRALLERFASERRVFSLDWPGFGASAKPARADYAYSVRGYVETLGGWLDTLGIARCVLAANGIAAAVALRYATVHPQRVLGLALLGPIGFPRASRPSALGLVLWLSAPFGRSAGARLISFLLGSADHLRYFEPAAISLAFGSATSDAVRTCIERHRLLRRAPDHRTSLAAFAALFRDATSRSSISSLAAVAKQVQAPTVVVRGALDPLVTAPEAHEAAATIGDHGALEVTLPEASHLPFLQQPERCFQAIDGLLGTAELAAVQLS